MTGKWKLQSGRSGRTFKQSWSVHTAAVYSTGRGKLEDGIITDLENENLRMDDEIVSSNAAAIREEQVGPSSCAEHQSVR